jgi:hypothetical protein
MATFKLLIVLCFTIFKTHASQDKQIQPDPAAPLLAGNNHRHHIRLPGQECESLGPLALIAGAVGAGACGVMCCTNPLVVAGLIASSATGGYGIIHILSACWE